MEARQLHNWDIRLHLPNIAVFLIGIALLVFSLYADWAAILKAVGFPVMKLSGQRGQGDLAIVRTLSTIIAVLLMVSPVILWIYPDAITRFSKMVEGFISTASQVPGFTAVSLAVLVLMKTVLQLSLYLMGYKAYAGDDFARALKADYWLHHYGGNLGWPDGWLSLGSAWLPFPDYVFGVGLALHRDLYLTPKIINIVLSGILVIVMYVLGRELFGRAAGLLTATVCAFQPWIVWLGMSGMTSDLPGMVMMALFGLFLFRWLETDQPRALLTAAGCLFVADGMRYESWFFSAVFSLLIIFTFFSRWRQRQLTRQSVTFMVCAIVIANAFPLIHMTASHYFFGDWIPALQEVASFVTDKPIPRINMLLLALSSFPLEIAAAMGGVALFLRSDRRKSSRVYLLVVVTTLLVFALVFKGRLEVHSAGPARYLLSFIILLLPYLGFLLARLFRGPAVGHSPYGVVAGCLLLLAMGTFDIMRAFNYPARRFDVDAFYAGWTLRGLQEMGDLSVDGSILIERTQTMLGNPVLPFPIIALAGKPERFHPVGEGNVGKACNTGFQTEACRTGIKQGNFNMIILHSPENKGLFQETFTGRSWQIGKYHIFKLEPSSGYSNEVGFTPSSQRQSKAEAAD